MDDLIRVAKAALWEEAKGKMRAMVAVEGQVPTSEQFRIRQKRWNEAGQVVEAFIKSFEDEGLHE